MSNGQSATSPASSPRPGCWPIALIVVGGLIAAVSGLCAGASLIGSAIDLSNGSGTFGQVFGQVIGFLAVSGLFLAAGIGLIVWGRRIWKARR